MPTRRKIWFFPLFVFACSLIGGLFGPGVASSAAASSDDEIRASLKTFTRVYSAVELNSASPVDPDKVVYNGAIPSMLRTLDPHSSFWDPKMYQVLMEDQRGQYFGVGMLVGQRVGKVIVMYPFPGSPAARAGLHPYDSIIKIGGKTALGLTTSEVADRLKGPRGSQIDVEVSREGMAEPVKVTITRDAIPRSSVNPAFRVRDNVAYVRVEQFNENTGREMDQAMKRLGEDRIEGLVLDLRGNPGGILNEGVAVAGRFLRKGQAVVSHRGRSSPERPYFARNGTQTRNYPIVVLVDRSSASAAEIVAGALQDHDRAWILGENTFGKGLVQSQFPLSANSGLLLTTAKYYTPSGRLIQRDYAHTSFLDYYMHKDLSQKNPLDAKMTDSGRTVYGGGGIAPDDKYDVPKANDFQIKVARREALQLFAAKYLASGAKKISPTWEPDTAFENEFHAYLLDKQVQFTEAQYAENHDWIKKQLKYEMYLIGLGKDEADKIQVIQDAEVDRAVDSLPKAKALIENAKNMLAQRTAR